MAGNPIFHRGQAHRQAGFTLLELTVSVAMVTGLAIMVMSINMTSLESMRSVFVAQQYRMLSQAVAIFMGRHHAALVALPADCAVVQLHADRTPTAVSMNCQLYDSGGIRVANGLQPTVSELLALNLLETSFSSKALLPSRRIMRDVTGGFAADTLAVQITKQCGSTANCNSGYRLQGLVFNQQPYDFERSTFRGFTVRENLQEAFLAMGGGAAVALAAAHTDVADLVGYKSLFKTTNPLRSNDGGVPGVLAMRSDFNSLTGVTSSDSLGLYASGGQMWDFSGQSLRGLSSFAASSIGAQQISANQLTISGNSDLQQLKSQALSTEKIKLPLASLGQACTPQDQSLAVASDGTGRLLICPNTGIWTEQNL
jgi:type II secretory pathway pseudopilin PulG